MTSISIFFLIYFILIPFDVVLPALGYLPDLIEVFVIFLVFWRLVSKARLAWHWVPVLGFIPVFFILSIVFGVERPIFSVFAQAVIAIKFFVFFYMFSYLIQSNRMPILDVRKIFLWLIMIAFVGAVVNMIWGLGYYQFFDVKLDFRANDLLPRVSGFHFNPNNFGMTIALGLIALTQFYRRFSVRNLVIIAGCVCLIFLSGSRVALFALLMTLLVHFMFGHEKGAGRTLARLTMIAFLALPLVLILHESWLVSATVENFNSISSVNDSAYIRGIMLYEGVNSAIHNFPFGWGLATFGSVLSEGSPVYADLGLEASVFLISGRGIYDSSIATILGELGFLGLCFYIVMIVSIVRIYIRTVPQGAASAADRVQFLSLLLVLLIYAITNPIFFADYPSTFMALLFAYVIHSRGGADLKASS